MGNLNWLWNYLRDLYKAPETYICRREHFRWMCYTSAFVEELAVWVSENRIRFGVEGSILYFQKKVSLIRDHEIARAGFSVAQAALETYSAAIYR